jgi:putative transposase
MEQLASLPAIAIELISHLELGGLAVRVSHDDPHLAESLPIQDGDHLTTVLGYVERNPFRAKFVSRVEYWKWYSLSARLQRDSLLWRGEPSPCCRDLLKRVNEPSATGDLQRLRCCVARGSPFGSAAWIAWAVKWLGPELPVRPRGRPTKQ